MNRKLLITWFVGAAGALSGCGKDNAQALAGTWMQVDGTDYAIVRPTEEGWIFEDESGRYPAVYEGGMLKFSILLGEVTVIYDSEAGTMLLRVGTREMDFKRADCSKFPTGQYLSKGGERRFYFGEDCTFKQTDLKEEEVLSRGAYDVRDSSIALHFASEMAQTWQVRNGEIGIGDFVFVREGTEAYAEAVDRGNALPRQRDAVYIAAMKTDLRFLVMAEEAYFSDYTTYTSSGAAANYYTSAGVTVVITVTAGPPVSYHGIATHTGTTTSCAIYIKEIPAAPAKNEGEPGCG